MERDTKRAATTGEGFYLANPRYIQGFADRGGDDTWRSNYRVITEDELAGTTANFDDSIYDRFRESGDFYRDFPKIDKWPERYTGVPFPQNAIRAMLMQHIIRDGGDEISPAGREMLIDYDVQHRREYAEAKAAVDVELARKELGNVAAFVRQREMSGRRPRRELRDDEGIGKNVGHQGFKNYP